MGLAHAWRRQGMWATAVTLLVPAALAVAVGTALLGGGLRGLGALGQIVTGPQGDETQLASGTAPARHGARLPAVPATQAAAAPPPPAAASLPPVPATQRAPARPAPAALAGPGPVPVARGPRSARPLATVPV